MAYLFTQEDRDYLASHWPEYRSRTPVDVRARAQVLAHFKGQGVSSAAVYDELTRMGRGKGVVRVAPASVYDRLDALERRVLALEAEVERRATKLPAEDSPFAYIKQRLRE